MGKFDLRSDNGIFLGYFETSKAFRVYNSKTLVVEEAIHVRFDEKKILKLDESFVDLRLDDGSIEISSSR